MKGVVYTETVVHVPPAELVDLAPYQVVIVEFADGRRVTGRSLGSSAGDRVAIGESVEEIEPVDGVRIFRRSS
jgi:uncharacterized OB-fold protein